MPATTRPSAASPSSPRGGTIGARARPSPSRRCSRLPPSPQPMRRTALRPWLGAEQHVGLTVETVTVDQPRPHVDADVYLLGAQARRRAGARRRGRRHRPRRPRARRAACRSPWTRTDAVAAQSRRRGTRQEGLGLAPSPCTPTTRRPARRPPARRQPSPPGPRRVGGHRPAHGASRRHPALFTLEVGHSNRDDERGEGLLAGACRYAPARPSPRPNPELADLMLARSLGREEPMARPRVTATIERARRERIAEARRETPAAGWPTDSQRGRATAAGLTQPRSTNASIVGTRFY